MGYCDFIPLDIAEKLKEKGMPVDIDCDTFDEGTQYQRDESWCNTIYAEVFDWLMENKDVVISIVPRWGYVQQKVMDYLPIVNQLSLDFVSNWQDAANAAINKALEMI